MQYHLIAMITLILVHCTQNDSSPWPKLVHFVVSGQFKCSFALPSTASDMDIHRAIADLCNISFPFEVRLRGEMKFISMMPIPSIMSTTRELNHIFGDDFEIPLIVHPTKEDIANYAALSILFGGSDSNVDEGDWYQFIQKCVESKSCFIRDLCDHFKASFICEDEKLISIRMHQKLTGRIDLYFVPSTVETFLLERNLFAEIIGLDHLAGKQLRYLDVRGNPLEIDLEPLTRTSPQSVDNPLRYLRVSTHQITWSLLGVRQTESTQRLMGFHHAVTEWFHLSVLQNLTVGHTRFMKGGRSHETIVNPPGDVYYQCQWVNVQRKFRSPKVSFDFIPLANDL